MMQVLGLVTSVGFLAYNKKLGSFVDDTQVSKSKCGTEILKLLTLRVLQVAKLDDQSLNTMFGYHDDFRRPPSDNATAGSHLATFGCFTLDTVTSLAKKLLESRHMFLLASHNAPPCGWPPVLLVRWSVMIRSPYCPKEEEIYASHLIAIRELVYRSSSYRLLKSAL